MLIEQKQLREVRKRAFDEVTICRRATEEALSALAEHFPDLDRSELEDRLTDPPGPHADAARQASLPADLLDAWQLLRTDTRGSFLSKRAMADSEFRHTKKQTTDLLVRLVTKAFRRKLRRFVKPNKPRSTYHRN